MDEPLVRYDGSGLSNKRWLHADERGSIIADLSPLASCNLFSTLERV